ncbi:hypothetical protein BU17DRAFT_66787 [Hysterangium stoloniferum]|nr:hypothetical protein BU17DRAFT_66787 [Hysterangium stoloniferum]
MEISMKELYVLRATEIIRPYEIFIPDPLIKRITKGHLEKFTPFNTQAITRKTYYNGELFLGLLSDVVHLECSRFRQFDVTTSPLMSIHLTQTPLLALTVKSPTVSEYLVASGGYSDVWTGISRKKKVAIKAAKRLR